MAKPIISDELWAVIEPLLPPKEARPKGGPASVRLLLVYRDRVESRGGVIAELVSRELRDVGTETRSLSCD